MDENKVSREEKIMGIFEIVKAQSEDDTVKDKLVMSGLRMAYDHGYMDGAAASA
ncbi:MAG: hypothetical protein IJ418_09235 [Clostridia bacterium]|nr:hypothetical protein [Clostridia bacterium]